MFGNQTSSSTFRSYRLNENILFIFIEPYPESQFKHFVKEIDRHIGIDETIPTTARLGFSVLGLLGCPSGREDLGTTVQTTTERDI